MLKSCYHLLAETYLTLINKILRVEWIIKVWKTSRIKMVKGSTSLFPRITRRMTELYLRVWKWHHPSPCLMVKAITKTLLHLVSFQRLPIKARAGSRNLQSQLLRIKFILLSKAKDKSQIKKINQIAYKMMMAWIN